MTHGSAMGLPWISHGTLAGLSWRMVLSWASHGFLALVYGSAMGFLQDVGPCISRAFTVLTNVSSMVLSWASHEISVLAHGIPWDVHG